MRPRGPWLSATAASRQKKISNGCKRRAFVISSSIGGVSATLPKMVRNLLPPRRGRRFWPKSISLTTDNATKITWKRKPVDGTMLTHPGVYRLRSNMTDWDETRMWKMYVSLTEVEAVFRSLKSELGLRPIFHHIPGRSQGHLFITVLAYQAVQMIRKKLAAHEIHDSWASIRQVIGGQQRVTAVFRRADERSMHIRKSTRAENAQLKIYQALELDPAPGKLQRMIV